jgi:ribosomal-protein-alanine N-acetyltransferase
VTGLKGERVTLRPFRAEEMDRVFEGYNQPVPYTWFGFKSRDQVRRRVETSGDWVDDVLNLAIEVEGRLVGEAQARRAGLPPRVFDLGFLVFDDADRGQGFGSEAAALITGYLFDVNDARRVQTTTDVENGPMRRILEKIGFVEEGILRGLLYERGAWRDYAQYGMTRDDYEGNRNPWTFRS